MNKTEYYELRKLRAQEARRTTMVDYLERKGVSVKKSGGNDKYGNSYYQLTAHNGFKMYGNHFYDNKNGVSGSIIDYVIEYEGIGDYKEGFSMVVDEILGDTITEAKDLEEMRKNTQSKVSEKKPVVKQETKPFILNDDDFDKNKNILFAYLGQTRKIDSKILQWCVNERKVRQLAKSKGGNVAFMHYDENGKCVGYDSRYSHEAQKTIDQYNAERKAQGKDKIAKSKIAQYTDSRYGFNIKLGDKVERIYFFEASIDLLSLLSLRNLDKNELKRIGQDVNNPIFNKALCRNSVFVGMCGKKELVIAHYMKMYPNAEIIMCLDNAEDVEKFLFETRKPVEIKNDIIVRDDVEYKIEKNKYLGNAIVGLTVNEFVETITAGKITRYIPTIGKDFNEMLVEITDMISGKKVASKQEQIEKVEELEGFQIVEDIVDCPTF